MVCLSNIILIQNLLVLINNKLFIIILIVFFILIAGAVLLFIKLHSGYTQGFRNKIQHLNVVIEELDSKLNERTHNLENALQRAEESNRLKSLFLANMSHEIRTPLNGIIGFSELIIDPEIDDSMKEDFAKHISQNSEQLLKLIDQIFHLSIIETGKVRIFREEFNLNSLLVKQKDRLIRKISEFTKDIKVIFNADIPNDVIFTDYEKLNLIIENLLDNALKFTETGYISIELTHCREEFLVKISDTGCGIGDDEFDIIFDPFIQGRETLRKIKGGSGLGLSNVKNYVILLGGKIWCEKNDPIGLIFYFTLPVSLSSEQSLKNQFLSISN